jgi:two-component system cell cycle response regulator DivK
MRRTRTRLRRTRGWRHDDGAGWSDNPKNMKLAVLLLEKAGYQALQAEDATDGIRLAREQCPDLILIDTQLPGMSGLEATRLIKADPATQTIPVIALAAFAMKGDETTMQAAGCDGYLAKPFRHAELIAAIERVLGLTGPRG